MNFKQFLRSLFGTLHGTGYLCANLMVMMKIGKPLRLDKTRSIGADLFAQVSRVMDEALRLSQRDHQLYARDRFIFICLREAGLRASELLGATMRAVSLLSDPATGHTCWVLRVTDATAKRSVGRIVPVATALLDAMVHYRRTFGLPPLPGDDDPEQGLTLLVQTQPAHALEFTRSASGRCFFCHWRDVTTRCGLHDIVKGHFLAAVAALQAAGDTAGSDRLPRASPHWLRHTFAMQALLAGQDIRTVASALGHATVNTTMVHTEQNALDQIASRELEQPCRQARVAGTALQGAQP